MLRVRGHRCATAAGVEEGLARIDAGPVDLLIVDQHLNDGTAFDLLRRLPERHRLVPAIVVTESPDVESAVEALQMAVADYVAKPATDLPARCDAALKRSQARRALHQSAAAIEAWNTWERAAAERQTLLHGGPTDRELPTAADRTPAMQPLALDTLSPRQINVVALLGEGLSNQQLAERLGISLHTVKNHVKTIFRKLEVASRLELVSRLRPPRR